MHCGLVVLMLAASAQILWAQPPNSQEKQQAQQLAESARTIYSNGDYRLAQQKWREALALDPTNEIARQGVARVDQLFGKPANNNDLQMRKKRDELRIGNHKIDVIPTIPKAGISTGLLMAYGHVFQPPFLIERVEKRILVNGVQVIPSLLAQRQELARRNALPKPSPEELTRRRRIETVRKEAQRIYETAWLGKRGKIQALLAQHPDLFSDVRVDDDACEVQFRSPDTGKQGAWVLKSIFSSPERMDQTERSNLDEIRGYIERDLRSGRFVVISSQEQNAKMADPRMRVNSIMQNATLTREQRLEQMKPIFGYETALDVIENYSATEWATKP